MNDFLGLYSDYKYSILTHICAY